ncbi:UDP-2,4-diacetamido-2,4,6-trideoxy-beta-L-altropyranose hydrolase, partial [Candidatus Sumerlaeota bacterium]|nr:UDP-2,4-diacetamido-2,4,6-trideoxy-beta-L-altropyranose hydrolase [Candidatus Sumerlaeota bacterium]
MNNEKTIIIRTDASSKMGIGHLMRCVALAQALKKRDYSAVFVSRKLDGTCEDILSNFDFIPEFLEDGVDEERDAALTSEIAENHDARCVMVDHYGLQERFRTFLVNKGLRLFVVDDLPKQSRISADVILNQNFGAQSLEPVYKKIAPETRTFLLGEKYVMFRQDILTRGESARFLRPRKLEALLQNKRNPNILVTFGGTDALGISPHIIQVLKEIPPDLFQQIYVVMGSNTASSVFSATKAAMRDFSPANLFINPDMAGIMEDADIAITCGGSTVYELAFMGVAPIILKVAENQEILCKAFSRKKTARVLFYPIKK